MTEQFGFNARQRYQEIIKQYPNSYILPVTQGYQARVFPNRNNQQMIAFQFEPVQPQAPEWPINAVKLLTDVVWDDEGNFRGLRKNSATAFYKKGGSTQYLRYDYHLQIWRKLSDKYYYLVRYQVNQNNPAQAMIIDMIAQPVNQDHYSLHPQEYDEKLSLVGLPLRIDVPKSVYRLMFGVHPDSNKALNDEAIVHSPLVAYHGSWKDFLRNKLSL